MKFAKKQGIRSDLKDKGPGRTDWTPKDLDVPEKNVQCDEEWGYNKLRFPCAYFKAPNHIDSSH